MARTICNVKMLSRLLISTCVVVFSLPAMADDIASVFQVDMIFFEHKDPKRFTAENWPKYVGKLQAKNAIDLSKLPQGIPESVDTLQILDALDEVNTEPVQQVIPDTVTLVEPSDRLLNAQEKLLKTNKDLRVIDYVAWSQPLAWNVSSTPIYIRAGKDLNEVRCLVTIKPAKGMYNVSVDMIYTVPASEKANKTGIREFRVTQDVKLKKKEMVYIDHPLMGAIIEIAPIVEEY